MRLRAVALPLSQLAAVVLITVRPSLAKPNPHPSLNAGFTYNELFARWDCDGTQCGYSNQLCCPGGSACYTNAMTQAACSATAGSPAATSGYWQFYTTTYVQTDLQTITSVMSTYVGAATTAPTGSAACNYALNETPCGSICCAAGQYCYVSGQCVAAPGGGSSGYYTGFTTPGAPLRGTSSGTTVVTATASPTTTVPFQPPVATGANVTVTSQHRGSGGLSGGAIAGIVIGVLVGIAILALICFYCCIKGLIDGLLACFGFGRRRKRTEVEEYERRSHHTSRTGAGGGRTWYGGARPPARVQRDEHRRSGGRTLLGVGAGLAALWAILGLKRRRENNRRRQDEKFSEYSYSSDYYTSASSASSDRRTRQTHRSMSRR